MMIKTGKWPNACLATALCWMLPSVAQASLLSPELMDAAAGIIAIVALIVAPLAVIAVFWLLHIIPEVEAEKRQHPQKDAIKAMCLASLFFGGLLWPLAWIWAHTKPVGYMLAYGRDKHDDYYREQAEHGVAPAGTQTTERPQTEPSPTEGTSALAAQIEVLQRRIGELESRLPQSSNGEAN